MRPCDGPLNHVASYADQCCVCIAVATRAASQTQKRLLLQLEERYERELANAREAYGEQSASREAEIEHVCVDSECRGERVARLLTDVLLLWAQLELTLRERTSDLARVRASRVRCLTECPLPNRMPVLTSLLLLPPMLHCGCYCCHCRPVTFKSWRVP